MKENQTARVLRHPPKLGRGVKRKSTLLFCVTCSSRGGYAPSQLGDLSLVSLRQVRKNPDKARGKAEELLSHLQKKHIAEMGLRYLSYKPFHEQFSQFAALTL